MSEDKKTPIEVTDKIRLRNNWLKIFVVVVVVALTTYKILTTNFSVDLTKFDFNAFLSLVLAIFSIGLAVAFFFKANDSSNLFYDNTYKFTKDMSTMLGRIEAGFGERLKHLDEGYSGLRDRFDKMPFSRERTEEKIKSETEELEKVLSERNKVIEDLAERAKLNQKQKEELLKNLSDKEKNLSEMQRELYILNRRLDSDHHHSQSELVDMLPNAFVSYISKDILNALEKHELRVTRMSYTAFLRHFPEISGTIHPGFIKDATEHGLFDVSGRPTEKFYEVLQELARRRLSNI